MRNKVVPGFENIYDAEKERGVSGGRGGGGSRENAKSLVSPLCRIISVTSVVQSARFSTGSRNSDKFRSLAEGRGKGNAASGGNFRGLCSRPLREMSSPIALQLPFNRRLLFDPRRSNEASVALSRIGRGSVCGWPRIQFAAIRINLD